MTLEIIQAKRAALLAECERAKGAIQALDDLISEVAADRLQRAQIAAFEKVRARIDAAIPPAFEETVRVDAQGRMWVSSLPLASESPPMSPPSPPEVFGRYEPVVACFCSDLKSDRCSNCTAGK